MENVLITGGCGFIGFNIVSNLMNLYNIQIVDNFNPFYDTKIKYRNWQILQELHEKSKTNFKLELIKEDILNENEMMKKVNAKTDCIIHLAAQPGVRESFKDRETYFKQNVEGTKAVLKIVEKRNVQKIINFSSSTVYGNQENYPLVENMVPKPISPYGESKHEAEKVCSQTSKALSLPIYTLRPFSVYGPQLRPELAISNFTYSVIQEKPIKVYGNGGKMRDFTYVGDIIQAVKLSMQANLKPGNHIFNVGSGTPISIIDLIQKIEKILNKKSKIEFCEDLKGDVQKTWASLEKIKSQLNFEPKINIDEGLKRYIQWIKTPLTENINHLHEYEILTPYIHKM